jgi:2-methylisocitrate lyase-like PEP mutase family enzyme
MPNQEQKAELFRSLHHRDRAFIIPNPFDPGSARILAHLGFEALATTSAGYAFTLGRKDGTVGRDEMLRHATSIVNATDLPVSADLENLYADDPKTCAETIRLAAATGLAGCSIEDVSRRPNPTVYDFGHAVDRVRAAAEAAHSLPFPFTLTARTENFIVGRPDLKDTIKRLQAFQEAGADVLFAPGLTTKDDIATVVRSVERPVNVIMGLQGVQLSLADLSALGVKRISIGSALSRAAFGALIRAAREMKDRGTFTFAADAIPYKDLGHMFGN